MEINSLKWKKTLRGPAMGLVGIFALGDYMEFKEEVYSGDTTNTFSFDTTFKNIIDKVTSSDVELDSVEFHYKGAYKSNDIKSGFPQVCRIPLLNNTFYNEQNFCLNVSQYNGGACIDYVSRWQFIIPSETTNLQVGMLQNNYRVVNGGAIEEGSDNAVHIFKVFVVYRKKVPFDIIYWVNDNFDV